jgi:hypothetical protein
MEMGKPELMMKGENREEDCSLVIQIQHVNSTDKCMLVQFEKRRRRSLTPAQGWSAATTLGYELKIAKKP